VAQSLKTGKQKTLIQGGTFARYLPPGYLLFAKGETVIAVPFDAKKVEVTGAAIPVLDAVAAFPQDGVSQFAISGNGTFAFLPSSFIASEQKLVSVDRKSNIQIIHDKLNLHGGLRVSPEGKRIAFGMSEAGRPPDVFVADLSRGLLSRVTHGPGTNFNPVWTPDGKKLLYTSERPIFEIYRKSADGSGTEEPFLISSNDKYALSISPDGKTLLFSTSDPVTQGDLWTTALTDPKNGKSFVASSFNDTAGAISPNGRWVAYQSDDTGQPEVYVIGFPAGENRVQVSTNGGSEPVWSRDGKELFYRWGNKLMEVPVQNGDNFSASAVHVVLEAAFVRTVDFGVPSYDVSPDGQRFYFVQEASDNSHEARLNFMVNWPEELKHNVPAHARQ